MELVCSVQAFNELLERPVLRRGLVEVFQPDDGYGVYGLAAHFPPRLVGCLVVEERGVVIGREAVPDQGARRRSGTRRPVGVVERGNGRLRPARLGEVVAADGPSLFLHDQPGVAPLAVDQNVGLVGRRDPFRHGHVPVHPRRQQFRRGVDVVDHRLVRDADAEESGQHVARLPGAQAAVDEKAEHQGQGLRGMVDAREVDIGAALRTSASQVLGLEVKLPELIAQLVVGIVRVPFPTWRSQ